MVVNKPRTPVVAALVERARVAPDATVLIADDEPWSASELVERSGRLAVTLSARGVGAGDRIAVHLHNRVETVLTYLAGLRLGAVLVPLNTRLTTPELVDLVRRTRPVGYVGEQDLYPRFAPVPDELVPADMRLVIEDDLESDGAEPADVAPDPDAPAILLSTSGTTGRSKIVIWSHRTLANLHLSAAGRGVEAGDVLPLLTPLMHGAGIYFLLNALTEGAVAVLVRHFDAGTILDTMARHRVTSVFGLPFRCDALVHEQRSRPRDVSALRVATVAGDVCPAEVETAFEQVFRVPLRSFWAATEDVGATVADSRVGPYLRVLPEAMVRIVGGELVIRSPTTSPGYWESETDITPMPADGFHSGDLVREVGPGLFRYVGRKKDLIIRGGSNISPSEVEDALRVHPDVIDAGVAGVADAEWGQRVGALVVLRESAGEGSVRAVVASVRGRLAGYKVPERVVVVDSIPRNALTKVDRAKVSETLRNVTGLEK